MGSAPQEGGSEGRGLGLRAQQAPWCLSGQGKLWPPSLLSLHTTPHHLPRVSPIPAGPLTIGGSRCVSELLPSPNQPSGVLTRRFGLYFCSPFPPSHFLRTCTAEGASVGRASGRGSQQAPRGPDRGKLAMLPFDPLPSQWSPNLPLQEWDPFPSPPATPQGHQSHPASTPPPPSLPPCPMSYPAAGVPPIPLGVHGRPPMPGRGPSCAEMQIPCPPSPPS